MTRTEIKIKIIKNPLKICKYYCGQKWLMVWFLTNGQLIIEKPTSYFSASKQFIEKYEDSILS